MKSKNLPPEKELEVDLKKKKLELLQKRVELRSGLPHLYGWKWYPWARKFFESQEKVCLLTAANQISKSSTQIRKCIDWATNKEKWKGLWAKPPKQFWYMYPSSKQVTVEWNTKWEEFLPRGKYKDDPVYGWTVVKDHGEINHIKFNSGVYVFFKVYTQSMVNLQSSTLDALFLDEELPLKLYDELIFRLSASRGYFNMVFTATIGQDFWRRAMEPDLSTGEKEVLPHAFKQTISLYDCKKYEDGTPSQWTDERIQEVVDKCQNDDEIQRRVFGRFIRAKEGLKYPSFSIKLHYKPWHPVPEKWMCYAGVDYGSGGEKGHPGAIVFIAVSPDYKKGRVIASWRGDGVATTAGDIVNKYIEMKLKLKGDGLHTVESFYDPACKDLEIISRRMGHPLSMAQRNNAFGTSTLDTLFKYDILNIYEVSENYKLVQELTTLRATTTKNMAQDNLADALRFAVSSVPFDFAKISIEGTNPELIQSLLPRKTPQQLELEERRKAFDESSRDEWLRVEEELKEANELYGN